jgi:hypothetical protein
MKSYLRKRLFLFALLGAVAGANSVIQADQECRKCINNECSTDFTGQGWLGCTDTGPGPCNIWGSTCTRA